MQAKSVLLTCAIATLACGWFVTPGLADETAIAVEVCVGADRVLRFIENAKPCHQGEQRFALASPSVETELAKAEAEKTKPKPPPAAPAPQVSQPPPPPGPPIKIQNRVFAPFEVVAPDGTVILRVAAKVSSKSGNGARVTIGAGDSGNYGIRVYKNGGNIVAGIGQSSAGTGVVAVMDDKGELVANMNGRSKSVSVFGDGKAVAGLGVDEGRGVVGVYHESTAVAYMTKSSGGDGGNVTVSLNDGFGVFSAGAAQDGAGEACVNRKTQAGTARLACLGLGLPSAGMGK